MQSTAGRARRDDSVSILWTDGSNRRFKFDKRRQLFIRVHNVTLSVSAMGVCNPDRSSLRIHG
jgi:hypothetical protein